MLRLFFYTLISLQLLACSPNVNLSAEQYLARSQKATSEKRPKAAIIDAKNALQKDPTMLDARWLLAQNYLELRNGELATKELDKLLESDFSHPEFESSYLQSMLLRGQYNEIVVRTTVLEMLPIERIYRAEAYLALADISVGVSASRDRDGYLGIAQNDFQQALRESPALQRAYFGLARVAFRRNQLEEANKNLEAAEEIDATKPMLWTLRGMYAQFNEDFQAAENAYERALALGPYDVLSQLNLARVLLIRKKGDRAGDILDTAVREHPSIPMLAYLRAIAYLQSGDETAASIVLDNTVKHFPRFAEAQLLLGKIFLSLGQYGRAEIAIEAVIDLFPAHEKALEILREVRLGLASQKDKQSNRSIVDKSELGGRAALSDTDATNVASQRDRAAEKHGKLHEFLAGTERQRSTILETKFDNAEFDSTWELAFAATQHHNNEPAPYHWIGMVALQRGKTQQAKILLNLALKRDPEFVASRHRLGDIEFRQGNMEVAKAIFEELLSIEGGAEIAELSLARIDIVNKNWGGAEQRISRVQKTNPDSIDTFLVLAELAKAQGRTHEQIDWLNQIIEIDVNAVDARMLIAKTMMAERRYKEANAVLDDVLMLNSEHPGALLLLSETLYWLGDLATYQRTVQTLHDGNPDDIDVLRALGISKWRQNEISAAKEVLRLALEKDDENLSVLQTLASLHHHHNEFEESQNLAEKIIALAEEDSLAHRIFGDHYLLGGDKTQAAKHYERSMNFASGTSTPQQIYRFARENGELDFARDFFNRWMTQNPGDAAVQAIVAMDLRMNGKTNDAIEAYRKTLRINPKNVSALNDLAWLYHLNGNPEALPLAEQAYGLNPNSPAIADTFGWLLYEAGQVERAIEILAPAADKARHSGDISYHLAAALATSGDSAGARAALARALDNQNLTSREEALQLSKKLSKDSAL